MIPLHCGAKPMTLCLWYPFVHVIFALADTSQAFAVFIALPDLATWGVYAAAMYQSSYILGTWANKMYNPLHIKSCRYVG